MADFLLVGGQELFCQANGLGFVSSGSAVFNADLHKIPPGDRIVRGTFHNITPVKRQRNEPYGFTFLLFVI